MAHDEVKITGSLWAKVDIKMKAAFPGANFFIPGKPEAGLGRTVQKRKESALNLGGLLTGKPLDEWRALLRNDHLTDNAALTGGGHGEEFVSAKGRFDICQPARIGRSGTVNEQETDQAVFPSGLNHQTIAGEDVFRS